VKAEHGKVPLRVFVAPVGEEAVQVFAPGEVEKALRRQLQRKKGLRLVARPEEADALLEVVERHDRT